MNLLISNFNTDSLSKTYFIRIINKGNRNNNLEKVLQILSSQYFCK